MASTPLNYIIPYFCEISTQNHINNLQNLICAIINTLINEVSNEKSCMYLKYFYWSWNV